MVQLCCGMKKVGNSALGLVVVVLLAREEGWRNQALQEGFAMGCAVCAVGARLCCLCPEHLLSCTSRGQDRRVRRPCSSNCSSEQEGLLWIYPWKWQRCIAPAAVTDLGWGCLWPHALTHWPSPSSLSLAYFLFHLVLLFPH